MNHRRVLRGPDYAGRSPEQIISERVLFDSAGYTFRALSWLDVAKRERNMCALHYAALDLRQGVEQLFFEEIVMSVGTKLDRAQYQKCLGNSTELHKILKRLNPDYCKLALFTQAVCAQNAQCPPLIIWDHKLLLRHWGKVSEYLHWAGEPAQTVESAAWFDAGVLAVEEGAMYIWSNNEKGYSAIMLPEQMQPEVRLLWNRFCADDMDLDAVKRAARIAQPILENRLTRPTP